ncbi:hypothetical protein, partial [Candidatus Venteria ishoeyi]|uniref:hypothetical protein n=1 Tax=Candidatus Venteria ishoeyi TaxID=1899563 RepID=UPI00255D1079
ARVGLHYRAIAIPIDDGFCGFGLVLTQSTTNCLPDRTIPQTPDILYMLSNAVLAVEIYTRKPFYNVT